MAWRLSVLGYGVGRYRRGRRMDLDRGAKRRCESQACAMGIATAVLLLALLWSHVEPLIIQAMKP